MRHGMGIKDQSANCQFLANMIIAMRISFSEPLMTSGNPFAMKSRSLPTSCVIRDIRLPVSRS